MRFVLAISALVLSGLLLLLGIGQTTFLAGPRQIDLAVELEQQNGMAVIPAEVIESVPGQANAVVTGVNPVVAIGNDTDVRAWVAPFDHAEVSVNPESGQLTYDQVPLVAEALVSYAAFTGTEEGEDAPLPSAAGSDLWLSQRSATAPDDKEPEDEEEADEQQQARTVQTLRMPVSLVGQQSVLVTVAADSPSMQLSLEWVQDRRTPWAGPLLAAGGLFALIGGILYLLAVDHDRRGLGPRRGRKGPLLGIRNVASDLKNSSKKKFVAIPALGITLALGLSGCSPTYWPDFSAPDESTQQPDTGTSPIAPVPISQTQIDKILDDVVALSNEADRSLDAAGLEARFSGDALVARQTNYKIRSAVSDYDIVVPSITEEMLGYQLVQSTESWPRTIFLAVASKPSDAKEPEDGEEPVESPSLALILTQKSPHDNYHVTRAIALRGGISMPEAAPAEEGTALLADDLKTLVLPPAEVGDAYAAVLTGGTGVEQAELFDLEGDSLIERSGQAWVAQSKKEAASAGWGLKFSVSAAQSDQKIVSLSTGTGGALVATTLLETRVEQSDGSRWRPTVRPSFKALSGLSGQQDKLVSVVSHQLLFYVPSATAAGPIELLGYSSDLVAARKS